MRGVSPSQTLPFAGGQPPAPPTSTSLTPQDQKDARTTMTKPSHAVPYRQPASALTPAGAFTARSSHAPAPPYHPKSTNATPCCRHNSRTTRCRHVKSPAQVSVSVPTLYDTGVGATEPTISPMFVYVQGQNRRSGCDQTESASNNDEPAQGTPARQAPTEDAEASIILM